jgi:epimerase transport system membrane fusion protein
MKILANASQQNDLQSITSMDGPKRAGLLLFGLVFGVFGLWAAFAPLEGSAYAPRESHRQVIQENGATS